MHACRLLLVSLLAIPAGAEGADLFVDNLRGHDAFDGKSRETLDVGTGPVQTLRGALRRAHRSDVIHLANTGAPYRDIGQLVGANHSGTAEHPFTIDGHGALVTGEEPVPAWAWHNVAGSTWQFRPWRKGDFRLFRDGRPVAEHPIAHRPGTRPAIPKGHWMVWHGSIFVEAVPLDEPQQQAYSFAARSVGLSLYRVHDVVIRDVTVTRFSLDGLNAHDGCRNVRLVNVRSRENGRAGLTVAGTSQVVLNGGELTGNRRYSLLVTERAAAELKEVQLDRPPTLPP